jgi:hypothetical protein
LLVTKGLARNAEDAIAAIGSVFLEVRTSGKIEKFVERLVEKFVVACLQPWSSRYYTCPQFIIDIWILHVSDITKQSTSDLSFRFGLSFRLRCASEVRGHCTLHIAHCTFPTGTYCYHSFFPRRVF